MNEVNKVTKRGHRRRNKREDRKRETKRELVGEFERLGSREVGGVERADEGLGMLERFSQVSASTAVVATEMMMMMTRACNHLSQSSYQFKRRKSIILGCMPGRNIDNIHIYTISNPSTFFLCESSCVVPVLLHHTNTDTIQTLTYSEAIKM